MRDGLIGANRGGEFGGEGGREEKERGVEMEGRRGGMAIERRPQDAWKWKKLHS